MKRDRLLCTCKKTTAGAIVNRYTIRVTYQIKIGVDVVVNYSCNFGLFVSNGMYKNDFWMLQYTCLQLVGF